MVNASHLVGALTKLCMFLKHLSIRKEISPYTTLLSNHIYPICKHVPLFALVATRHKRGMGEGKRFF